MILIDDDCHFIYVICGNERKEWFSPTQVGIVLTNDGWWFGLMILCWVDDAYHFIGMKG
jgi:hypothetical protein